MTDFSTPTDSDARDADVAQAIAVLSLINSISNRMTATGTATYANFGLGLLEARLLYVLAKSPPTAASRMSERLGVDPAAISRAVARLGRAKLLEKGARPKRFLLLTEEGEATARTIKAVFEDRALRLVEQTPQDELERLLAMLQQLQRNLASLTALAENVRDGRGQTSEPRLSADGD